jgi:hypothetical protein
LPGLVVRLARDFLDCPTNHEWWHSFIDRDNLSIGEQNLEVRITIELPAEARFVFSGSLIYPCATNALRVCAAGGVRADGGPCVFFQQLDLALTIACPAKFSETQARTARKAKDHEYRKREASRHRSSTESHVD